MILNAATKDWANLFESQRSVSFSSCQSRCDERKKRSCSFPRAQMNTSFFRSAVAVTVSFCIILSPASFIDFSSSPFQCFKNDRFSTALVEAFSKESIARRQSFYARSIRSYPPFVLMKHSSSGVNCNRGRSLQENPRHARSRRRVTETGSSSWLAMVSSASTPTIQMGNESQQPQQIRTLLRVGIPAVAAGVVATLLFPSISLFLVSHLINNKDNAAGIFQVLSQDLSQFVQNFLSISSLLFSIIVGQTYYFL
jgi:hypothetical protein